MRLRLTLAQYYASKTSGMTAYWSLPYASECDLLLAESTLVLTFWPLPYTSECDLLLAESTLVLTSFRHHEP